MIAAVFKGNGRIELEQRQRPQLQRDDDVIVQIGAVGLCGSDLHMLDVPPKHPARVGAVLGHEFAGKVVECGDSVRGVEVGDHVVIDPNAPCGECGQCRNGRPNACTTLFDGEVPGFPNSLGVFRDGGMAEYARVRSRDIYRIGQSVPYWAAALAEPLACALSGARKVRIQPGEHAVVLGAGPIGLMFIRLLKVAGARVIASERIALRREAARACGADVVVDPGKEDVNERVLEVTGREGADVVVEAVGTLFGSSVQIAAMGGRVLLFGMDERATPEVTPGIIIRKELTVYGNYITKFTFSEAVKVLERGLLPAERIVTSRLPLKDLHQGLQRARNGEEIKLVFQPTELE